MIIFFVVVHITILSVSGRKWKLPDKNSFFNPFSKKHRIAYSSLGNVDLLTRTKELRMNVYFVTDHIDTESFITNCQ
ncbi:hypothetical protein P615_08210 [Brevibacillus laterosporus PE36]|nr:hypothetical protein P615_08210 [Brevibacillus laterosporus PE36]